MIAAVVELMRGRFVLGCVTHMRAGDRLESDSESAQRMGMGKGAVRARLLKGS